MRKYTSRESTPSKAAEVLRTQNLYQAAFCLCRVYRILGTEQDGYKVSVIFEGKNIRENALEFYNGGQVEAKAYSDAYRSLKDLVFQR